MKELVLWIATATAKQNTFKDSTKPPYIYNMLYWIYSLLHTQPILV